MQGYSSLHFALFRIALGLLLCHEFISLAAEVHVLFGADSLYQQRMATPFPNLLTLTEDAAHTRLLLIGFGLASLVLAAGVARRPLALLLWYGWACVTNHHAHVGIPSDGYVGWLLLACAIVPPGERLSLAGRERADWYLPQYLYWSAWIVLGVSYSVSGWDKLGSESWRQGSALLHVMQSPIARWPTFNAWVIATAPGALKLLTWGFVGLECVYAVLCLAAWTRRLGWCAMVLMHSGVLAFLAIEDVSWAMLVFHIFVADERWLGKERGCGPPRCPSDADTQAPRYPSRTSVPMTRLNRPTPALTLTTSTGRTAVLGAGRHYCKLYLGSTRALGIAT